MGAGKYDNLTAAAKLTELLETMKVTVSIPAKLTDIAQFADKNNWSDAPTMLAEVRHGYVHPNRRRRAVVLAASNLATFEAWQLSVWYQELGLLYFLNHQGEYRNRLTGQIEKVPWA